MGLCSIFRKNRSYYLSNFFTSFTLQSL